jgi:hypothetical protein
MSTLFKHINPDSSGFIEQFSGLSGTGMGNLVFKQQVREPMY